MGAMMQVEGVAPSVRRARGEDALALAALIGDVGVAATEAEVTALIDRGLFMVLDRVSGGIAAAACVQPDLPSGILAFLAVARGPHQDDLRRRLVAVAEAICAAMGCRELRLEVLAGADELAPWYRELGYREGDTATGDRGDGHWMQKQLLAA